MVRGLTGLQTERAQPQARSVGIERAGAINRGTRPIDRVARGADSPIARILAESRPDVAAEDQGACGADRIRSSGASP